MYLIDTNVILEILLDQAKKDVCKNFLDSSTEECYISDFSLHSVGVVLFRSNKELVFRELIADLMQRVDVVTLPKELYESLSDVKMAFKLDFDDAYQFSIAKSRGMSLVTMDADFKRVQTQIDILFL